VAGEIVVIGVPLAQIDLVNGKTICPVCKRRFTRAGYGKHYPRAHGTDQCLIAPKKSVEC
jgi:uncharacterized Zn finger protein (UPF0148 family)